MFSVTISVHDTTCDSFEQFLEESTILHMDMELDGAAKLIAECIGKYGMEVVSANVIQKASSKLWTPNEETDSMGPV